MSRALPILCLLICLSLLPGCGGYSATPLTIDGATSISVPIFDNQTFWRGLEFDLTEAVSAEVRGRTGLRLVRTGEADLILRGDVIEYDRPVLTEGARDVIKEGSVRAVVRVTVTRRDGTVVREKLFTGKSAFVLSRGENEQSARAEAFEDMAEDIVNLLDRDWQPASGETEK